MITQHKNRMSVRTTRKLDFLLSEEQYGKVSGLDTNGKQKLLQ